jgi:hypothetical protein
MDWGAHSNSWANLASVLMLLVLIMLLFAIHLKKWFRATPVAVAVPLIVSLLLLSLYVCLSNRLTILYDGSFLSHAQGQRYVIGLEETEMLRRYRADDPSSSTSTIIDDFPERIDGLWEPSSVYSAFLVLGGLYVLTVVSFAATLIIAADLGLAVIVGVYRGQKNATDSQHSHAGTTA